MNLEEASNYFKLISDPNRLVILKELTTNLHMCGSDLLKKVNCKQATLSHHLTELTTSGLLNSKKSGNKVIYSLNATKYNQLTNFLNKIDRINKEENIIRVSESPIINKRKDEKDLPTFLL